MPSGEDRREDRPDLASDAKPIGWIAVIGSVITSVVALVPTIIAEEPAWWLIGLSVVVFVIGAIGLAVLKSIELRQRSRATTYAYRTTAAVWNSDRTDVVGYALPVTSRHLLILRSVFEEARSDENDRFVTVRWDDADAERDVAARNSRGSGPLTVLDLMPGERLPRGVRRLSVVRGHDPNKSVVADAWHPGGQRWIHGVTFKSTTSFRVEHTDRGSDVGTGLRGAPLLNEKLKLAGVVDGNDGLGPSYQMVTRDQIRQLVGDQQWWRDTGWTRPAAIAGAVVLVAALVVALPLVISGPGPCTDPTTLNVLVSTEKDGLIDELAASYEADHPDRCVDIRVAGVSSGDAAEALADNWSDAPADQLHATCPQTADESCEPRRAPVPDLWLPTSSVWPELLDDGLLGEGDPGMLAKNWKPESTSVASSILTILVPEDRLGDSLPASPTWQDLVTRASDGTHNLSMAIDDPIRSTSGMGTSVVLNQALEDMYGAGSDQAVTTLRKAIASVPKYLAGEEITQLTKRLYDDPSLMAQVDALVAQEQTAYLYNCGDPLGETSLKCTNPLKDPKRRLVAVTPDDTTYAFDHPAVEMRSLGNDSAKKHAADDFVDYLTDDDAQQRFREWGFRPASEPEKATDELEKVVGAVGTSKTIADQWPPSSDINRWREEWSNVRLPVRVLLSIDVSGSMVREGGQERRVDLPGFEDACPGGQQTNRPTYLQVAQNAALRAIDQLDDGRDSVGIDSFPPAPDPKDKSPTIRLLNTKVRGEAKSAICSLRADGNTPLYAALGDARDSVEASTSREKDQAAIVLLSDGGQFPAQRGGLSDLLADIGGEGAVPVTAVGIGSDAPVNELTRITQDTGGSLEVLKDPQDIATLDGVLVDIFKGL